MAIFEKVKIDVKITSDESAKKSAKIISNRTVNGHTEYVIRVERLLGDQSSSQVEVETPVIIEPVTWIVNKRYSDFYQLNFSLQSQGIHLDFPGKKLTGKMDREFIAKRQAALQKYLDEILSNLYIHKSIYVQTFLDPHNFSQRSQDTALQHVSLSFRNNLEFELLELLPEIGWRSRKSYFQVRKRNQPKTERILTWTDFGSEKYLEDRVLQSVAKSLVALEHPYIAPLEFCEFTECGGMVVQPFLHLGSIRDALHECKPKTAFIKKYGQPPKNRVLEFNDICVVGCQILKGLKFLHDKGFGHGSLHAGNILLKGSNAQITDIQNYFCGVSGFLRPLALQLKLPSSSLESLDVYCFGHIIYEMAFGRPLNEPVIGDFPPHLSDLIKSLLTLLLSEDAMKSAPYPSLNDLLSHPLFSGQRSASDDVKGSLKFSSSTKQAMSKAKAEFMKKLQHENQRIKIYERDVRRQRILSNEEEKRKRKEKRKKTMEMDHQRIEGSSQGSSGDVVGICQGPAAPPSPPPLPQPPVFPQVSSNIPTPPPLPSLAPSTTTTTGPGFNSKTNSNNRRALLGSITDFNKAGLKKTATVDKSQPKL